MSIKQKIGDGFDAMLLAYIEQGGEPILGPDGEPLRDDTGKILMKPGVGIAKVIRERLKDCGVTTDKPAAGALASAFEKQRAAAVGIRFNGNPVPPVSDMDDAATA